MGVNAGALQQARRRLAKRVLIGAACLGVVLTSFTEKGSGFYDLGTMLILATLVIGSFVAVYFAKKRAPLVTVPPSFAPETPFMSHLRVKVTAVGNGPQSDANASTPWLEVDRRYFMLLGTEGFSVRFRARSSDGGLLDAQLLQPEEVLEKLSAGTVFHVYDGARVVAEGTVMERLTVTEPAPPGQQS